jgi:hypothetical protein
MFQLVKTIFEVALVVIPFADIILNVAFDFLFEFLLLLIDFFLIFLWMFFNPI